MISFTCLVDDFTVAPATVVTSSKCEDRSINGLSCQGQLIRYGFYLCYSIEDRCCRTCALVKNFGHEGID